MISISLMIKICWSFWRSIKKSMLKLQSWIKLDLGISALNYVNGVKNNEFTAEEFISESLDHIKQVDDKLHAFLRINDFAIKKAKEIDAKIKSNQNVGRCYGMPISVKDNICIEGSKTTCASKVLENFIAPHTSTVVSKLYSEDSIIIGKTNMDEFAMGLSTEFSLLITVEVYGAIKFSKTFDAQVVFEPSMHILSLTDIGIP